MLTYYLLSLVAGLYFLGLIAANVGALLGIVALARAGRISDSRGKR